MTTQSLTTLRVAVPEADLRRRLYWRGQELGQQSVHQDVENNAFNNAAYFLGRAASTWCKNPVTDLQAEIDAQVAHLKARRVKCWDDEREVVRLAGTTHLNEFIDGRGTAMSWKQVNLLVDALAYATTECIKECAAQGVLEFAPAEKAC